VTLACVCSPPIIVDARKRTKGERPDADANDVRLVQRQRGASAQAAQQQQHQQQQQQLQYLQQQPPPASEDASDGDDISYALNWAMQMGADSFDRFSPRVLPVVRLGAAAAAAAAAFQAAQQQQRPLQTPRTSAAAAGRGRSRAARGFDALPRADPQHRAATAAAAADDDDDDDDDPRHNFWPPL